MFRLLMRRPDGAELAAFATLCALVLFAAPTPLVEQFATVASSRGFSPSEAQSLLVACVFGCLAGVAAIVWLSFAALRRLRR